MAYEPTNWKDGDVITAEKLNKIENGIKGSGSGASEIVFRTDTASVTDGSVVACNYTVAQVRGLQIDAFPICKLVRGTSRVYYGLMVQIDVDIYGYSCTVIFSDANNIRYVVTGSTSSGEWTIRQLTV